MRNRTSLILWLLMTLAGQDHLSAKPYQPTWESLKSAPVPEWIMDAKFGIYTHWGVYSVPAFATNVYGQEMYVPKNSRKLPGRGLAVREYHAGHHIVSLCDLVIRGGILLLSLTPKGDGSIPAEEVRIMREIGAWLKVAGEGIYGTRPWKTVGEGIDVDQIRTVAPAPKRLGQQKASWQFQKLEASQGQAIRFTRSKDYGSLYAFVIGRPESGRVTIKILRRGNVEKQGRGIRSVSLLGSDATIDWGQTASGLTITFPGTLPCKVACGFKIQVNGRLDDVPRDQFDEGIPRKGDWPIYNSKR